MAALSLGRVFIGCEIQPEFVEISRKRLIAAEKEFSTVDVTQPVEKPAISPTEVATVAD